MRYVVSGLVVLAALALLIAAGWMNWRFMTGLAADDADRHALGLASLGVDALKAALAYLMALAWDRRQWGYVGVGLATYALLAAVSLASSFGFAAEGRDAVISARNCAGGALPSRRDRACRGQSETERAWTLQGQQRHCGRTRGP